MTLEHLEIQPNMIKFEIKNQFVLRRFLFGKNSTIYIQKALKTESETPKEVFNDVIKDFEKIKEQIELELQPPWFCWIIKIDSCENYQLYSKCTQQTKIKPESPLFIRLSGIFIIIPTRYVKVLIYYSLRLNRSISDTLFLWFSPSDFGFNDY